MFRSLKPWLKMFAVLTLSLLSSVVSGIFLMQVMSKQETVDALVKLFGESFDCRVGMFFVILLALFCGGLTATLLSAAISKLTKAKRA